MGNTAGGTVMIHIYYCTYCEQDVNYICVNNIDETYKDYDIEYHGICDDCLEQAKRDEISNYNYHRGLLI